MRISLSNKSAVSVYLFLPSARPPVRARAPAPTPPQVSCRSPARRFSIAAKLAKPESEILLQYPDQGSGLVRWMRDRVAELIEDLLMMQVASMEAATRANVANGEDS